MGARAESVGSANDGLKWAAAALIMGAALGAFYYFADQSQLLRVIGMLLATGVAVAIAMQTEKGRIAFGFVKESRTEVRKVVWPTRTETIQTTGIVLVMVTVVALFIWLLDTILGWSLKVLLS